MENKIKVIRDAEIFDVHIKEMLCDWLVYIGVSLDVVNGMAEEIKKYFIQDISVFEVEEILHKLIWDCNVSGTIDERLKEEEELVFDEIKNHFVKGNTLDVGTGSGKIAQKVNDAGFPTTIIDVIDFNKSNLKLTVYDGENIPFPENEFENVTLMTVLHHCQSYMKTLNEVIRVSKNNIIIIESVYTDQHEYYCDMFFDWLWNRVVYRDVNVPFNFNKPEEWEKIFREKGLTVDKSIDLGYDSPMTPEHHWLFVLKK